jgi:hypothetical protein
MYVLADRDWTGAWHLIAGLLLCAAAAALLFASFGGGAPRAEVEPAAAPPPPSAGGGVEVRHEHAGHRFEVVGASFLVLESLGAPWASAARTRPMPSGVRRVVLAVEVTNRTRDRFNPGLLSYLLKGPDGALYAPDRGGVVGPTGLGLASGLPRGSGAEERLVFTVPARLRRPVLAIQPSPARPLEVRVRLGRS